MKSLLAVAALCFPFVPLAAADAPARRPPNIIFIMADDLGWTDLACQGSKFYETPNIDRLAKEGMRFTNGYTCGPNCQPTRAALMSGQYVPRTGVYTVGATDRFDTSRRPLVPVENVTQLPRDKVTVAEAMKAAGYTNALFGKWHLGNNLFGPDHQGFDETLVSMGQHFNFATKPPVQVPAETYLADYLTDRALAFMEKNKDKPFFLCLHHFAVHSPHQAKKELIERFKNKPAVAGHRDPTYAAMIASVDESVGRVMKKLDELKLADNTLVIFTSDNGGVGGYVEAGVKANEGITNNAPLRGGKGMLYEGGVRVPWIARWPGRIKPGTTCDEPILSVDLYPTLLDLAGGKAPSNYPLDGVSFTKLLFSDGTAKLDPRAIYWHFPGYLGSGKDVWRTTPVGSIRLGDWKLLEFLEDGRLELYNLREDVGEKKNLASAMPDKVKELHAKMKAWRVEVKAPMPAKREPPKP
jgi:arylsulfatase A-like enzyme